MRLCEPDVLVLRGRLQLQSMRVQQGLWVREVTRKDTAGHEGDRAPVYRQYQLGRGVRIGLSSVPVLICLGGAGFQAEAFSGAEGFTPKSQT